MRLCFSVKVMFLCTFMLFPCSMAMAQDCNNNGVDDSLDISSGTSCDNNSDGVPDECISVPAYEFLLDTDPGWTTEGLWAWGTPTGQGGVSYGNPDPTSGYTGSNVYGYNLNGDYTYNTPETSLTSTAIDCTGLSGVKVAFQRWLNVESSYYANARFSISLDNAAWTVIWENPTGNITENAWTYQEYDVSAIADNQPTVYLRWSLEAGSWAYDFSGWNIDDVQILIDGVVPPADCNGNSVDDICDITAGTSSDCNGNDTPDECEALYSGGSGTAGDPWQIATAQDLIQLADTPCHYSAHFLMTGDIDMAGYPYTTAVIAPDGNSANQGTFDGSPFTGVFDGDGYAIVNLTIDGGTTGDFLGLFGRLEGTGEIRNLGVRGGSVTGDYYVGGLVGSNIATHTSPNLITACYSTAAVTGKYYVGGLAGASIDGNIELCLATGTVTAGNNMVGGLVGHFHDTGSGDTVTLVDSYATGAVTGNLMVGGLVGYKDQGAVRRCYSSGTVTGSGSIGALIGSYGSSTPADSQSCYVLDTGTPTGGYGNLLTDAEMVLEASFVGFDFVNNWSIYEGLSYPYLIWQTFSATDCNSNTVPDELELSQGIAFDCNGNGTLDVCDIASSFSDDVNSNNVPDECEPDCDSDGLPDSWEISQGISTDVNGNGIPDDCETDCDGDGIPDEWEVTQGTGFDCNNNDVLDECELTAGTSFDCNGNGILDECDIAAGTSTDCNNNTVPDDCDLSGGTSQDCDANGLPDECDPDCNSNGTPDACESFYSGGAGTESDPWQIASAQDLVDLSNTPCHYSSYIILTADIDMAAHPYSTAVLAPNTINSTSFAGTSFTGTFDGNGHVISNLTISGGTMTHYRAFFGRLATGAVVRNLGLEDISVAGTGYYVCGLVGVNYQGTVTSCYVTGTVNSSGAYVGGLVGYNYQGNVENCYTNETVAGSSYVGGLAGYNYASNITSCYAGGSVSGSSNVGELIGSASSSTIQNGYYLDMPAVTSSYGTALTDAAMRQQASFVGFDFANVWGIVEDQTYPYLAWQTPAGNDCNSNGVPDDQEPDCDGDGVPNDCETDTDGDSVPDECDADLTAAVSRKAHTTAGDWDIDVGIGDIECRSAQLGTANANELLIIATFSTDVQLLGGSDVLADVGTVTSAVPGAAADTVEVTITDLPLVTQLNLTFPGVVPVASATAPYASSSTLCMRVIVGDYDNLGRTNFIDFAKIKSAGYLNQLVGTADHARADFDCGGRPNFIDFSKVKSAGLINQTAPACTVPIGP